MAGFFYYLTAVADSGLSVVGIRSPYEQPPYQVIRQIADNIEIRAYPARPAVETAIRDGNDGEAFGKLFRYITGANHVRGDVAMTVPVQKSTGQKSRTIAMTAPVQETDPLGPGAGADAVMRFFLPKTVADAPPVPTDPSVHLVTVPADTEAVIRFSGIATDASRASELDLLRRALKRAGVETQGVPSYYSYDPPFALPFVRRNEIALAVKAP
jgi:hypothetical protein